MRIYGTKKGAYQLSTLSMAGFAVHPAENVINGLIDQGATVGFTLTVDNSAGAPRQTLTIGVVASGDLNGDATIDCNDIAVVRRAFGKKAGQAGFNAWADWNADGIVDIRDLAAIAHKLPLGMQCP